MVLIERADTELRFELFLFVRAGTRVAIDTDHILVPGEKHRPTLKVVYRIVGLERRVVRVGVVNEPRGHLCQLEATHDGALVTCRQIGG